MNLFLAIAALALSGWKGETVSFRFDATNVSGGVYAPRWEKSPAGWDVKGGVMRGVRYLTKVHGTEYGFAPDRVEWNGVTNLPPNGICIAVGQVKIPADAQTGDYELSFGGRDVRLRVVNRTLPSPKDWKTFTSGFWHHPWALARVTKTTPWTPEHFEAMRPFLDYTAALGVRTIMTTICDLPWNHQCFDPNWTMVRHVRNGGAPGEGGTGEWSFDYTVFDKWVEFNLETGNGPNIYCYALCPWDYELWYHDESGRPWHFNARPGTKEFDEYWTPFLVDFRRHLIGKGWFDKTYLASDERDPSDVKAFMGLLRRVAPDFRVLASACGSPELFSGFRMGGYDQILTTIDEDFLDQAHRTVAAGGLVDYYVCCSPERPNTFVDSDPDDAFWLPVFAAANGLSGFVRWTIDSFPENAMEDATYACWPSGDTFLVYPDGSPSWRYLGLLNGFQNAEKWRIVRSEGGEAASRLGEVGIRYNVQHGLNKQDGDFRELIEDTLSILNDREGSVRNLAERDVEDGIGRIRKIAVANGYELTETAVTAGCLRVSYVLRPTAESFIRCQVALPIDARWSGRFWGFGNGGAAGEVDVDLAFAANGDVAVHTDMGTSRGVYGKPEVVRDFGWRATHLMTVSGKELAKAFFGRAPDKCYFHGSSTGGGQAFHEVLRFPEDYDGVLAYVPANTRIPLHVYFAWTLRNLKDADGKDVFRPEELAAVEQAAIDWFADKDVPSARGKYLTDTRYSPETEKAIVDLALRKVPSLSEGDKIARLHRIFEGPVINGMHVHAGVPFSASISGGAGNQWMLRWFVGPERTLHAVTDAELQKWMDEWGRDCDACGEGFAKFAARGGKLIVVGGLEDSVVPYQSMIDWYERATRECGGRKQVENACRLYLMPGREHGQGRGCGGIVGDRGVLVRWVENGIAPFEIESPLREGGTLTVKPYPYEWSCRERNDSKSF